MTNEINLLKIANSLLKRLWIIILALILGASAGYFYTDRYVRETYTATTTMYVRNQDDTDSGEINGNDISVSQKLVDTFLVLLTSNKVINEVKEVTGLNYTVAQLKSMIYASSVNDTEVFSVSVTCESAENAALIANALADYGPAHMTQIVNGGYISVIDRAEIPTAANSRNKTRNAVVVGMLLAVIAAGVISVITILDTRIKDDDDMTAIDPKIPMLGMIPSFDGKSRGGYYGGYGSYGYGNYGYGYSSHDVSTAKKQTEDKK